MTTTTAIAEYNATRAALAEFRELYQATVWDVGTPKRMVAAKKARAEIRKLRLDLEAERKRIKGPALARCKEIDTEAKLIEAEFRALEEPVDHAIKEVEQKAKREKEEQERLERERITAARAEIDLIRSSPVDLVDASMDFIHTEAERLKALTLSHLAEFEGVAMAARDEAVGRLQKMYTAAKAQAEEQARIAEERADLEKQQREQAERDRVERERRDAQDRARRAKLEADEKEARERRELEDKRRAEQAAKERAAREKAEAEDRARRAKIEADERKERQRQEDEARKVREAEEARLRVEREKLEAEKEEERQRQRDIEAAEQELQREKDEAEAERRRQKEDEEREKQREINERLDARGMLESFVEQYGRLEEFHGVAMAIHDVLGVEVSL